MVGVIYTYVAYQTEKIATLCFSLAGEHKCRNTAPTFLMPTVISWDGRTWFARMTRLPRSVPSRDGHDVELWHGAKKLATFKHG